jgi:hypothetical protein
MKIIVTNATGSQKQEALLDKDSGVIEFNDGEISHVLHEKNMSKTIFVVKDAKKEIIEPVKAPSLPQSAPVIKSKTKRK